MSTDPLGLPGYADAVAVAAGGSSTVWRAREVALHRWVAVKVLSQPVLDPDVRRRFDRELALTGQLSAHPHVVTVYGSGFTRDGRAYIVSEWCPSGSLVDLVATSGRLAPEQVAAVGANVAGALAVAHEQGVVHRDVKPANVMVTAYGEAALADFGIAASGLDATAPTNSLTPVHAAPEVLQGALAQPASDLWGLGSTLWTALTGTSPFAPVPGEGVLPLMVRIQSGAPPALPDGVPPGLADVLHRLLSKDPAARPGAAEAAAALRALAVGAAPLPLVAASPPPASDEVAAAALPVEGLPVEALDGEHTVVVAPRGRSDAPAAAPEQRRRRMPLLLAAAGTALAVVVGSAVALSGGAPAEPARKVLASDAQSAAPTSAPTPAAPSDAAVPPATVPDDAPGAVPDGPAAPDAVPAPPEQVPLPPADNGTSTGDDGAGEVAAGGGRSDDTVTVAEPPAVEEADRPEAPGAPVAVKATGGDRKVSITWRHGATNGSALTAHTVRDDKGGTYRAPANAVGYTLATRTDDRVCVTVTASNGVGESPRSAPVCATPAPGAPGQPGAVAVTSGDGSVRGTWGAAAAGSSPVTGYVVTLSPGGTSRTTTADARSASFTGLRNGTAYTLSVVARTRNATGPARTSAATVPSRVPGAPGSLRLVAGSGTITGTWSAAPDGGSALTGYTVYLDGRKVRTVGAGTRSLRVSASNGARHTYSVLATNSRGSGPRVSGTATPTAPQPARAAVYRCENPSGDQMYTRSGNCEGAGGYTRRASGWAIATQRVGGTTDLFRLARKGVHVSTVDAREKDSLVRNGWKLDGTTGYVRTSAADGWTKINRMVKGSYHVYVRNGDVGTWQGRGYRVEGAFWA